MISFDQRQTQTQNNYLVRPPKLNREAPQPRYAHNLSWVGKPLPGNQTAQRFAQSCPLRLPSPSVCPFGGVCHTCPVQAKLKVNEPGDKYEQEADRIADQVMRMPEPLAEQIILLVQRQVEPEEAEEEEPAQAKLVEGAQVQRQEEEPGEEEEEPIQTKRTGGQIPRVGPNLATRIRSLKGGGRPLPQSARDFFEPRFGYDFSQVRVHTGVKAVQATQTLGAQAFTTGKDIVFATGQFEPTAPTGKRLLAHELTHVIQQKRQASFPHILQMRKRRRRRRKRRIMGWKQLSSNIYQATMNQANLIRLANAVSGNTGNWVCIKPVKMQKPNSPYANYRYNVKANDTFDVSYLTSKNGATLNLALFSEPILSQWAMDWFNAKYEANPKARFERVANQGKQIQRLILIGHPLTVHWVRSGRRTSTTSHQIGHFSIKNLDPNKPKPSYQRASSGAFPNRCFFTRNAGVTVVGCNSKTFAANFAKIYLRRGSTIAGTKKDLFVEYTVFDEPTIVGQPPIKSYKWKACFARYNIKRRTYRCLSRSYRKAKTFLKAGRKYWAFIKGKL